MAWGIEEGSSSTFCHWSRVPVEQHHGVADQLGDRLGAGAAEEGGEPGDLGVVELGHLAVLALDLHLGEPR